MLFRSKDARIGENCNLCSHVFIENDVIIGDEVTVKCGVQLWDGVTVHNQVFIGPNATFINDRSPRSKLHDKPIGRTIIMDGASIGANSTVMCGVRIGRYAMVGAGSVITKDVGDYELWYGNPAVHRGYVSEGGDLVDLTFRSRESGQRYQFADGRLVAQ